MTSKQQLNEMREKYRREGYKLAIREMKNIKNGMRLDEADISPAKPEQIIDLVRALDIINTNVIAVVTCKWIAVAYNDDVKKLKALADQSLFSSAPAPRKLRDFARKISAGENISATQLKAAGIAIKEIQDAIKKAIPLTKKGAKIMYNTITGNLEIGAKRFNEAI